MKQLVTVLFFILSFSVFAKDSDLRSELKNSIKEIITIEKEFIVSYMQQSNVSQQAIFNNIIQKAPLTKKIFEEARSASVRGDDAIEEYLSNLLLEISFPLKTIHTLFLSTSSLVDGFDESFQLGMAQGRVKIIQRQFIDKVLEASDLGYAQAFQKLIDNAYLDRPTYKIFFQASLNGKETIKSVLEKLSSTMDSLFPVAISMAMN